MNYKQFLINLIWIIGLIALYLDLKQPVIEMFTCEVEVQRNSEGK
jgi:hypothetical protein